MKPGRELDKLVAEKVLGWKWFSRTDLNRDTNHPGFTPWSKRLYPPGYLMPWHCKPQGEIEYQGDIPNYSTDIEAAWEVVEKMKLSSVTHGIEGWVCYFGVRFDDQYGEGIRQVEARALTAPHAICLAALKAMGVEISE